MCALADVQSRVEAALRCPPQIRIEQLEELIACSGAKELQAALPPIVASIFGLDGRQSWGLCAPIEGDVHPVRRFLSGHGAMLGMCYKLIADPHLKYLFPVRLLPYDLVHALETGRVPHFYSDLPNVDPHTRQAVSLSLNPFDYYMFHFAVHLYCTSYTREAWDAWNTLYYDLACEYLLHFLPDDVNTPVLPHIPYFTGKTPAVSPMQSTNRHSQFPSLLMSQDSTSCAGGSGATQFHPRGEVWRSETVLQVFVDVWLNTSSQNDPNQTGGSCAYPAGEHVRIARALIKQCHAFSSIGPGDPTSLGELRRATSAVLTSRAHAHIRHLMHTWPLDASFRLVLELWFSFIQPWRYMSNNRDRKLKADNLLDNASEGNRSVFIDSSFIPFISENLSTYTEIFQLVVPRFLRMNLCVPKNAVMLFRLTKVFSQSNLVRLLMDVENSVAYEQDIASDNRDLHSFLNNTPSRNLSNSYASPRNDRTGSSLDSSGHHSFHQIRSPSPGWEIIDNADVLPQNNYRPLLLGGGRNMARDLLVYASQAYSESVEIVKTREESISKRTGFFTSIYSLFVGEGSSDEISLEEVKKVPVYLRTAIAQLSQIFSLDVDIPDSSCPDNYSQTFNGTQRDTNNRNNRTIMNLMMSPKMAKERVGQLRYMGDPDLQPVKSYENAFLVKTLQQISSKINNMYREEISVLWNRTDAVGHIAKEVLSPPCKISTTKGDLYERQVVTSTLPPRIVLRYFASHTFLFWLILCSTVSYFLGYGIFPVSMFFIIAIVWILYIVMKGSLKWMFNSS